MCGAVNGHGSMAFHTHLRTRPGDMRTTFAHGQTVTLPDGTVLSQFVSPTGEVVTQSNYFGHIQNMNPTEAHRLLAKGDTCPFNHGDTHTNRVAPRMVPRDKSGLEFEACELYNKNKSVSDPTNCMHKRTCFLGAVPMRRLLKKVVAIRFPMPGADVQTTAEWNERSRQVVGVWCDGSPEMTTHLCNLMESAAAASVAADADSLTNPTNPTPGSDHVTDVIRKRTLAKRHKSLVDAIQTLRNDCPLAQKIWSEIVPIVAAQTAAAKEKEKERLRLKKMNETNENKNEKNEKKRKAAVLLDTSNAPNAPLEQYMCDVGHTVWIEPRLAADGCPTCSPYMSV
jgi:hypothetical protein